MKDCPFKSEFKKEMIKPGKKKKIRTTPVSAVFIPERLPPPEQQLEIKPSESKKFKKQPDNRVLRKNKYITPDVHSAEHRKAGTRKTHDIRVDTAA